ncbi:unnamed protein product [Moneuplotes crassus]|uniref:Uncharacterized protein n=1 Tax=Euplotes crassus TaxID=5936 RepID=A0AAD1UHH6_EUPCR|nr:unnamed protein product [Moneuplotes crassus]
MISKYNQLSVNSISINKRRRKSQNKTKLLHSKSAFKMMRNNTKPYPVNMSMVQKSPKESKNASKCKESICSTQTLQCVNFRKKKYSRSKIPQLENDMIKIVIQKDACCKGRNNCRTPTGRAITGLKKAHTASIISKNIHNKDRDVLKYLNSAAYHCDAKSSFKLEGRTILESRSSFMNRIKSTKKVLNYDEIKREQILQESKNQAKRQISLFTLSTHKAQSRSNSICKSRRKSKSSINQHKSVYSKEAKPSDLKKLGIFEEAKTTKSRNSKYKKSLKNWSFDNEYNMFTNSDRKRIEQKVKGKPFWQSRLNMSRKSAQFTTFYIQGTPHKTFIKNKRALEQPSPTKLNLLTKQSIIVEKPRDIKNKDLVDFCNDCPSFSS